MAAVRCCIESCPTKKGDYVPLHSFPRENAERRQAWTNFVRATKGTGSVWTPSKTSRLCARHFTLDCYRSNNYVGKTMISSTQDVPWQLYSRWLRPDSVPTVNGGRAVRPAPVRLIGTKVPFPSSRSLNEKFVALNSEPEVRSIASQTVDEAPRKKRSVQTQCCVERYWKTTQSTLATKTASVKTQTRCVKREKNGT